MGKKGGKESDWKSGPLLWRGMAIAISLSDAHDLGKQLSLLPSGRNDYPRVALATRRGSIVSDRINKINQDSAGLRPARAPRTKIQSIL